MSRGSFPKREQKKSGKRDSKAIVQPPPLYVGADVPVVKKKKKEEEEEPA